jgi:Photosynthetic reaction centre cytochrome C subunit
MRLTAFLLLLFAGQPGAPQPPAIVETPTVTVLTGLTVHQFETEMQLMTQALGASCGTCHVARNFASENNPRKLRARQMLEMTKAINQQFFPDHKPADGESRLGRITCFTCHQGDLHPKPQPLP